MFKVGSDPEVFLVNKSGNLVSAIDVISGDKHHPLPTINGSIQHDNIMAEFNSKPADTLAGFIDAHKKIMNDLRDHIRAHDLSLDLTRSAAMVDWELLSDPRTQLAGCEPDFNAWLSNGFHVNESPVLAGQQLRGTGGHLHISFDQAQDDLDIRVKLVKALDLVLGVPSVLLDKGGDLRKTLYGKAGACRYKFTGGNLVGSIDPYDGVEYRVLSNFWLRSEELMKFVYRGVETAVNELGELSKIAEDNSGLIINTINTNDKLMARKLCDDYRLLAY